MAPTGTAPETTEETNLVCDPRGALAGVVAQARELVAGLDPDAVLARHAPQMWDSCGEAVRLFAGAQTLLARRVADAGVHKDRGHRDTAEYLAARSGATRAAMANMLATSNRLPSLPATEAAVRSGGLSADQAHAVADGAHAAPDKEEELLAAARQVSLTELRDAAVRAKAHADPDPEATRKRQHDERHFGSRTGADGRWLFSGSGTPEDRARFEAALGPYLEAAFQKARAEGRHEPRTAHVYDALQEMANQAHDHHYTCQDEEDDNNCPDPTGCTEPEPTTHDGNSDNDGEATRASTNGTDSTDNNGPDNPAPKDNPGNESSTGPASDGDSTKDNCSDDDPGAELEDGINGGDPKPGTAPTAPPTAATNPTPESGDPIGGEEPATAEPEHDPVVPAGENPPVEPGGADPAAPVAAPPQNKRQPKRRSRPNLSLLPILRLDLTALHLLTDDACEINGNGPITLTAARELLADSVIKLVLTRSHQVRTVAHIGRAPPKPRHIALLHADITDLTANPTTPDEPACLIPGTGTVPIAAARARLGHLDGIDLLDRTIKRGVDVDQTHLGRQPTTAQKVALLWSQPACSVAGCPHTFTQIDHRTEWRKHNLTELMNLDRLCVHHHRLKTTQNYQLVPGTGDRAFVPPTDPDHPDHHNNRPGQTPPHAA